MKRAVPLLVLALTLSCQQPDAETAAHAEQCRALLREASSCAEWKTREEALKGAHYSMFRKAEAVQAEYDRGVQECKKRERENWSENRLEELEACRILLRNLNLGLPG